jgi:hypothetical protein
LALFLAFSLWLAPFGLASVAMTQEKLVGEIASIAGGVTLTAADGASFPAAGVRLILNCESERLPRVEISDERGAFRFESVPADGCTIVTDLQGFSSRKAAIKAGAPPEVQFHLETEPIFAGVTVTAGAPAEVRIRCHVSRTSVRPPRPVRSAQIRGRR